jgi:hypothetical protein
MRLIAAAVFLGVSIAGALAQDAALPRAAIEDGFKKAECSLPIEDVLTDQQSFDLGNGKKLFLVNCWRAAYQSGSIVFFADGAVPPRLLTFQSWDGKKFVPFDAPSEAEFDLEKKTLSSFHKGRGIGDCGSMGEWTWTGTAFKMSAYFYKEKCDGKPFAGGKRWQIFPRRS